jgi:predicted nucleic acid-binding protein
VIVPDTTAWVDYANGVVSPKMDILKAEIDGNRVITTDVIIMEFLRGFNKQTEFDEAVKLMNSIKYIPFWGKRHMMQAVNNYRFLRTKGITIRKGNDVVIATFCLEYGLPLLHNDRDFDPMEKLLGLKIVR